jgi:hypothetical protein
MDTLYQKVSHNDPVLIIFNIKNCSNRKKAPFNAYSTIKKTSARHSCQYQISSKKPNEEQKTAIRQKPEYFSQIR